MVDLSPYQDAASGGETYVGAAVSYDPMGVPITAPAAHPTATGSGSGGTLPAASYRYKVTFTGGTPVGETTPSPATTVYVASGSTSSVALSVIPTGGTGTTGRNIYRSTDAVNYFLLHQIANNSATTYTDDGSGTLAGIVPPLANTTNVGGPGLAPAPTEFVPVTDDTITADIDQASPPTMRGSDLTSVIMVPTRIDPKGDVTWLTNPALGPIFIKAHFGGYTTIDTATGTATGPVATQNGTSLIPVTVTGAAPGMMVDVGTGSTKERTIIISYTAGAMVTYELTEDDNAHSADALTVTLPSTVKYARSILDAGLRKRIPLLCIENGAGDGDWAWVHRDMAVDQLDFTFSDKEATVKTMFVGSADPLYYSRSGLLEDGSTAADGTTNPYAPNADDEAIALHPFTSRNCFLAAYGDPAATGASSVRAAIGATNVQISSKAALKKYAPMNGGHAYTYFRVGSATCELSYDLIQTALRMDVWEDAIRFSKAVALAFGAWDNFGTASSPVNKGISIYAPNVKYKTDTRITKIGDIDQAKHTAMALAGPGIEDYLVVYIAA